MFYQLLVSNYTCLFDTIHALIGAHVDPLLVVNQYGEVVSINDFLWDSFQENVHVFGVW